MTHWTIDGHVIFHHQGVECFNGRPTTIRIRYILTDYNNNKVPTAIAVFQHRSKVKRKTPPKWVPENLLLLLRFDMLSFQRPYITVEQPTQLESTIFGFVHKRCTPVNPYDWRAVSHSKWPFLIFFGGTPLLNLLQEPQSTLVWWSLAQPLIFNRKMGRIKKPPCSSTSQLLQSSWFWDRKLRPKLKCTHANVDWWLVMTHDDWYMMVTIDNGGSCSLNHSSDPKLGGRPAIDLLPARSYSGSPVIRDVRSHVGNAKWSDLGEKIWILVVHQARVHPDARDVIHSSIGT